MHKDMSINVEYLTRVEGHGNIVVNVREGRLEQCRLDIIESPRFFEGMLRGRPVFEAPISQAEYAEYAPAAIHWPPSRLRKTPSASHRLNRR